jgi:hypothetical protein
MPCGSKIGLADFVVIGGHDPGTGNLLQIIEKAI